MISNALEIYKSIWKGILILDGKQKQRLINRFIKQNEGYYYYLDEFDDYKGPFETSGNAISELLNHVKSLLEQKSEI